MGTRETFIRAVTISAFILSYILAIIVIIQILRILFGGSWSVEEVILALMAVNITLTLGMVSYLFRMNDRFANIDKKIHGHLEWHRGVDKARNDR